MDNFYEIQYTKLTPESKTFYSESGRIGFYKTKEAAESKKKQLENLNPSDKYSIHEQKFSG